MTPLIIHEAERIPDPLPVDGCLVSRQVVDAYIDGTGQVVRGIHPASACAGRPCAIHSPSDHHMRAFPTHFRFDRYLMERICPHGVGHPDPDDMAFQLAEFESPSGVHGCDGCCREPHAEHWNTVYPTD